MSLFVRAYKGRTMGFTVTITNDAGTTVVFGDSDKFRVKIGRHPDTPILDLSSAAATANGTTVSAANPSNIVLDQDDAALLDAGVYDIEASIVEAADGGRIKAGDEGILYVVDAMAGSLT